MGAVYLPTHDHGFVLHHHSNDNTCLFCLFVCFLFWHSILILRIWTKDTEDDDDDHDEATGEKKSERWWEIMRKKCSLANSGHLIYSGSFILCFFWDTFYIYMHFVFLCCDLKIFCCFFCVFLCFSINYSHRNKTIWYYSVTH